MVIFSHTDSRGQALDFPLILLSDTSLAILSSPRFDENQTLIELIKYFDKMTRFLILISFLSLILISCKSIDRLMDRLLLAIDFFGLSLGRGF